MTPRFFLTTLLIVVQLIFTGVLYQQFLRSMSRAESAQQSQDVGRFLFQRVVEKNNELQKTLRSAVFVRSQGQNIIHPFSWYGVLQKTSIDAAISWVESGNEKSHSSRGRSIGKKQSRLLELALNSSLIQQKKQDDRLFWSQLQFEGKNYWVFFDSIKRSKTQFRFGLLPESYWVKVFSPYISGDETLVVADSSGLIFYATQASLIGQNTEALNWVLQWKKNGSPPIWREHFQGKSFSGTYFQRTGVFFELFLLKKNSFQFGFLEWKVVAIVALAASIFILWGILGLLFARYNKELAKLSFILRGLAKGEWVTLPKKTYRPFKSLYQPLFQIREKNQVQKKKIEEVHAQSAEESEVTAHLANMLLHLFDRSELALGALKKVQMIKAADVKAPEVQNEVEVAVTQLKAVKEEIHQELSGVVEFPEKPTSETDGESTNHMATIALGGKIAGEKPGDSVEVEIEEHSSLEDSGESIDDLEKKTEVEALDEAVEVDSVEEKSDEREEDRKKVESEVDLNETDDEASVEGTIVEVDADKDEESENQTASRNYDFFVRKPKLKE